MSVLPVPDVTTSRTLGTASVAARYAARTGRARGHLDALRTSGAIWNDEVARPVAGGWPVLEVPTADPVEIGPLLQWICAAARSGSQPAPG